MKKYEGAVGSVYGGLLFHSVFFLPDGRQVVRFFWAMQKK
jgi:hypothetical protein